MANESYYLIGNLKALLGKQCPRRQLKIISYDTNKNKNYVFVELFKIKISVMKKCIKLLIKLKYVSKICNCMQNKISKLTYL